MPQVLSKECHSPAVLEPMVFDVSIQCPFPLLVLELNRIIARKQLALW